MLPLLVSLLIWLVVTQLHAHLIWKSNVMLEETSHVKLHLVMLILSPLVALVSMQEDIRSELHWFTRHYWATWCLSGIIWTAWLSLPWYCFIFYLAFIVIVAFVVGLIMHWAKKRDEAAGKAQ